MKLFIAGLLVNILRKMNVTVLIGVKVNGDLTVKKDTQLYYNNDFSEAKLFYENGQQFTLPNEEFIEKSTLDEETGEYKTWYKKHIDKSNK